MIDKDSFDDTLATLTIHFLSSTNEKTVIPTCFGLISFPNPHHDWLFYLLLFFWFDFVAKQITRLSGDQFC